jgi:hypothetical protein
MHHRDVRGRHAGRASFGPGGLAQNDEPTTRVHGGVGPRLHGGTAIGSGYHHGGAGDLVSFKFTVIIMCTSTGRWPGGTA